MGGCLSFGLDKAKCDDFEEGKSRILGLFQRAAPSLDFVLSGALKDEQLIMIKPNVNYDVFRIASNREQTLSPNECPKAIVSCACSPDRTVLRRSKKLGVFTFRPDQTANAGDHVWSPV